MSGEKSMDRLGPRVVLMIPSLFVMTSADAIWKLLRHYQLNSGNVLAVTFPTSTKRLTVNCGAQNEGKEDDSITWAVHWIEGKEGYSDS